MPLIPRLRRGSNTSRTPSVPERDLPPKHSHSMGDKLGSTGGIKLLVPDPSCSWMVMCYDNPGVSDALASPPVGSRWCLRSLSSSMSAEWRQDAAMLARPRVLCRGSFQSAVPAHEHTAWGSVPHLRRFPRQHKATLALTQACLFKRGSVDS